jgi:hypothetical protein
MSEQKTRVHEIDFLFRRIFGNVNAAEFDIRQLLLEGFLARQLELRFVDIGGDDCAPGRDQTSHLERYIAASAADFEAGHARPNPSAT